MALLMAMSSPVAATGHHGDIACLESQAVSEQTASWGMPGADDADDTDASVAAPCCLPCAQCATGTTPLAGGAMTASLPQAGPGLGQPSGPPDPFERPPRH